MSMSSVCCQVQRCLSMAVCLVDICPSRQQLLHHSCVAGHGCKLQRRCEPSPCMGRVDKCAGGKQQAHCIAVAP